MKDGALICTKAPLHGFFGISVMMPFTYGEGVSLCQKNKYSGFCPVSVTRIGEDFRERGC